MTPSKVVLLLVLVFMEEYQQFELHDSSELSLYLMKIFNLSVLLTDQLVLDPLESTSLIP